MLGEALARVRTSVRLRTDVRRYAMAVLDAMGHAPLAADHGGAAIRTLQLGPDPLRILIAGGGLAVGYGVRRREDAIDGPLARLIAEHTGRGVIVDDRAVQHVRVSEVRRSLGAAGTHTFHLLIWCPSFAEGLERLSIGAWEADLERFVEELHAERPVPVLLTHMPVPAGLHPKALIARPWVHRINRMISRVAARHVHVADVATEPFFPREVGEPITDPAYFDRVARRLVPRCLALLGVAERVPAALAVG